MSSYGSSESRSDDEELSEDDSDSYSDDNDVDVRKSGKKNSPTNKNSFKQQQSSKVNREILEDFYLNFTLVNLLMKIGWFETACQRLKAGNRRQKVEDWRCWGRQKADDQGSAKAAGVRVEKEKHGEVVDNL